MIALLISMWSYRGKKSNKESNILSVEVITSFPHRMLLGILSLCCPVVVSPSFSRVLWRLTYLEKKCQAPGRELMRGIAVIGDKSRPKPALRSTHAGNGMKKKKKMQCFQSVLPRRGHPLSHLRGQTCRRCYTSVLMVNKMRV